MSARTDSNGENSSPLGAGVAFCLRALWGIIVWIVRAFSKPRILGACTALFLMGMVGSFGLGITTLSDIQNGLPIHHDDLQQPLENSDPCESKDLACKQALQWLRISTLGGTVSTVIENTGSSYYGTDEFSGYDELYHWRTNIANRLSNGGFVAPWAYKPSDNDKQGTSRSESKPVHFDLSKSSDTPTLRMYTGRRGDGETDYRGHSFGLLLLNSDRQAGYLLALRFEDPGWFQGRQLRADAFAYNLSGVQIDDQNENKKKEVNEKQIPLSAIIIQEHPVLPGTVRVINDEAAIAAGFLKAILDDTKRRHADPNDEPIVELDELQQKRFERLVDQLLRWHVGTLKPGPILLSDGEGRHARAYEFAGLASRTAWASRIFGSDWYGLVQYSIFGALGAICGGVLIRWRRYPENREKAIKEVDSAPKEDQKNKNAPKEVDSAPNEEQKSKKAAPSSGVGRSRHEKAADLLYSRAWLDRALLWFIPSCAFAATVVSIGQALTMTGGVLSNDPVVQKATVTAIANTLGTAFNTTLIGLAASIPAFFMLQWAESYEDRGLLVTRSNDDGSSTPSKDSESSQDES